MQMAYKDIFFNRFSKAIVDILLLAGLVLSIKTARTADYSWGSFHCIVSMSWYVLMLVHIWQHWRLTKALAKLKVMKRNIITTLTVVVFILMTFSVFLFLGSVNEPFVRIHHIIAHLFWGVIIIHAVKKSKRFVYLFKK
jgi:hypothetical protein